MALTRLVLSSRFSSSSSLLLEPSLPIHEDVDSFALLSVQRERSFTLERVSLEVRCSAGIYSGGHVRLLIAYWNVSTIVVATVFSPSLCPVPRLVVVVGWMDVVIEGLIDDWVYGWWVMGYDV